MGIRGGAFVKIFINNQNKKMRNKLKKQLALGLCVMSLFFVRDAKAELDFSVSLIKTIDSSFLWEPTNVNGTIYSGSYNASPSVNQKYYSASDPSSSGSWHSTEVPNTKNHESTRTYNLNGKFYVTSEGVPRDESNSAGSLILPNGTQTATFEYQFSLLGAYYNGNYIIGWAPRDDDDDDNDSASIGTKLYSAPPSGGKTLLKYIPELMAFNGVEYNGKLFLSGCDVDKFYKNNGSGMLVEMDKDWSYKIVPELKNVGGIGRLKVFDNKLFIATGKNVQLYSYDGSKYTKEKEFASDLEVGSMEVYDDKLFVAVTKQATSYAEIWYRTKESSTWKLAISNDKFKALGTAPGGAGNLINASGWLITDSKALYAIFTKGSSARQGSNGGVNQSYIYKVTSSGTENPVLEEPSDGVPADFSGVEWLDTNISGWQETKELSSITFNSTTINLDYDDTSDWQEECGLDNGQTVCVNANPWIFIPKSDVGGGAGWYAVTWEWLKSNQNSKALTSVSGGPIERSQIPSDWVPTQGVTYGFLVSGLARNYQSEYSNVEERTNVLMVKWAEDTVYDPTNSPANPPVDQPVEPPVDSPSNSATISIYLRDDSCASDQGYRMLTADPQVWQTNLDTCTTDGRYYCVDDNQKCSTTSGSASATVATDKDVYAPGETITVSSSGSFVTSCVNPITSQIVAIFQEERKTLNIQEFTEKGNFSNNGSTTFTAPTTVGSYSLAVAMDYSHPPFYYSRYVTLGFEVKEGGQQEECTSSEDCDENSTCEEGLCVVKTNECTSSEDCDENATCEEGYCVFKQGNREYCQIDDPFCDEHTCQDVHCFDGCEYLQGLKDCKGRE
jgi:hypothetical protein